MFELPPQKKLPAGGAELLHDSTPKLPGRRSSGRFERPALGGPATTATVQPLCFRHYRGRGKGGREKGGARVEERTSLPAVT